MKQILMLFTLLAGLTMQAQVPSYVPTDGLVGYWPFNGNANDESGNGNDGVVNGATLTEDRDGNPNSAYNFDGVDDFIEINTLTQVAQDSDYTWSFWSNFPDNQFSGNSPFNATGAFITCYSWWLTLGHSGAPGLFYKDEAGAEGNNWYVQQYFNQYPSINDWHHFILIKQNTVITVFLDGQNVGSLTSYGFSNFNSGILWYGRKDSGQGSSFYEGLQDDFGYWNRALTEEEILALYNANDCSVSIETIAGDLTPFTLEENTYNCTNTPNSTYEWEVEGGVITSGQGTSTVTVLWAEEGAGSLTVTETTEDGCDGAVSIEVEIVCSISATAIEGPLGPGELLEVTYTCDGDASSTYNWSISNGVITSGQGTNSVTVIWASTGLGSISVQETTAANCDGDEITLDVVVVLATGIHETLTESINIFPNPASTSVTITIDESLINSNYQLFDAQGKLVSEGVLSKTNTTLNTTGFASGNYVISIANDQGVVREQIIIER